VTFRGTTLIRPGDALSDTAGGRYPCSVTGVPGETYCKISVRPLSRQFGPSLPLPRSNRQLSGARNQAY